MEDLRSAEREGPSPSEACQIRREKIKLLLLGLIRTSTNTEHFVVCACRCLCMHVLIKQRSSAGRCVVLGYFHHSSLFYEAPKLRDSPNKFNESEDPLASWEHKC